MSRSGELLQAVARRGLLAALSLVGVVVLVHVLLRAAPGDAADLVAASPALREQLVAAWGLEQPLPVAVLQTLRGELGESLSLRPGTPVVGIVAEQAPRSLALLLVALGLLPPLALGLARLERSPRRRGLRRLVQAGRGAGGLPSYLLAFLLVTSLNETAFALIQRGLISRPAWFSLPDTASVLRDLLAVAVLLWGGGRLGAAVDEVEQRMAAMEASPALDALRARGRSTRGAVVAGVLPVLIALPGQRLAAMLGALVIVEKVLLLPGAGATFWDAVVARDLPVALGLALAGATLAVGLRWLGELGVLWADPRLRTQP